MRDWFAMLETREQLFVGGGAALVVIALFYALIWRPLDNGQETLAGNVANWERSLAELRPLKGMQPSQGAARRAVTGSQQTPVVIVDQSLRARGLDRSLKRSQPTTSNGIRVEFENVAFDDLVLWLGDLSKQHAMHVSSGSFSAANRAGPGRINATLT
ncbi:MAG: type II secretion system protein M, partial [Gammaproteobacteria bacterium]|nr:type II secretion system protein M [Gammaproteobacteria bacterium]